MKNSKRKFSCFLAIIVMLCICTTGCGKDETTEREVVTAEPTAIAKIEPTAEITAEPEISEAAEEVANIVEAPEVEETEAPDISEKLDETQLNSLNMLNYIIAVTNEINAGRNNIVYLEEVYNDFYDNWNRNALDAETVEYITKLFNTLHGYIEIDTKRDRIQYVYEQMQAQAIRETVVNAKNTVAQSVKTISLRALVGPILYMPIDSTKTYESTMSKAELAYIKDGWNLDDKETKTLNDIKSEMFEHSWKIVNEAGLPDELTLAEANINDFVEWKNNDNKEAVLEFFTKHEDTFEGFGLYWLTRAQLHYEKEEYAECIAAITAYEDLNVSIFRNDYYYAQVLPLAIASAKEVLNENDYLEEAERYAGLIIENTADNPVKNGDWALHYFAAQTYVDLYALTEDEKYLNEAYEITSNSVNCMVDIQRRMNDTYLEEVEEIDIPNGLNKEQKTNIKEYNKQIKANREIELPPVYEPLLLNCELLFDIADVKGLKISDAQKLDAILHENGEDLFLTKPIDNMFRISAEENIEYGEKIEFDGDSISIPAQYIADGAVITVTVTKNDKVDVMDDWKVEEVDRDKEGKINTFTVEYRSKKAKDYKYKKDADIVIEILPRNNCSAETITAEYKVAGAKKALVFNTIKFNKVD